MNTAEWNRRWLAVGLAGVLGLATSAAAGPPVARLERVISGLDLPLLLTHAGDGSGRLFVVEQRGRVRIYDGGALVEQPFLDLTDRTACCGERGLLGLAFHPLYPQNGFLFVNYTALDGDTVVSRFTVSQDPDRVGSGSEVELLRIPQPFSNHNGGHLAFGPGGDLYIATGDGGGGGDPENNAQSLDTLLGKILRIDVDAGAPYAVPADNPFVGVAEARAEIWAYGLRNPWRFSFDRATGDLYIGDVGQGRFEEIDFQPAASRGGENYGWRIREGEACFAPAVGCAEEGLTPPVLQYGHGEGCSVTGGYRYRGPQTASLDRFYLYGDFCSGRVWGARPNAAGRWRARTVLDSGLNISSFGEDEAGELYLVDLGGSVYRLIGRPIFADGFESGDLTAWSRARGAVEVVAPGLGGSGFALAASVGGGARKSFVRTNRPNREETLQVCFRFQAEGVELDDGGSLEVLQLRGSRNFVRLDLERRGRGLGVALAVLEGGRFRRLGRTSLPRRRPAELCVDWARATAADAGDGEVRLTKGGRVRVERIGLDNHRETAKAVRIGLPAGSTGARAAGRLVFDDLLVTP